MGQVHLQYFLANLLNHWVQSVHPPCHLHTIEGLSVEAQQERYSSFSLKTGFTTQRLCIFGKHSWYLASPLLGLFLDNCLVSSGVVVVVKDSKLSLSHHSLKRKMLSLRALLEGHKMIHLKPSCMAEISCSC